MSSSLPAIPKVAARYVGGHTVLLSPAQGRHFHTDGRERTLRALHTGEEILIPATEVLGLTQYTDPTRVQEPDYFPEFLGVGKVVKPEHRLREDGITERSLPELQAIGYEFSEGRPDFVPLNVPDVIVPLRTELPSASAEESEAEGGATGPGLILGVHAGALNLARRLPAVAVEVTAEPTPEPEAPRRSRRRNGSALVVTPAEPDAVESVLADVADVVAPEPTTEFTEPAE